jgi:hypothetical protein
MPEVGAAVMNDDSFELKLKVFAASSSLLSI